MHRIPLRFALPGVHAILDVLLLLTSLYHGYIGARVSGMPFAWTDDGNNPWVHFDYYVPNPLMGLVLGTAPASLLATAVFPGWIQHHPFDRAWAGLHLALATAFWYAAGWLGERFKACRIGLLCYLVFRAATLPRWLSPGHSDARLDMVYMLLWLPVVTLGAPAIVLVILGKVAAVFVGQKRDEAK